MSLKTFLNKLWKSIAKIFEGLKAEAKKSVKVAITIVDNLKNMIEGEGVDVLTAAIPGTLDDSAVQIARYWIKKILLGLHKIEGEIDQLTEEEVNRLLLEALKRLKDATTEEQRIYWHGLASLLAEKLADGNISWSDSVAIAEYVFTHKLHKEEDIQ